MDEKLVIQKDNHIVQKAINKFSYKQNQLMCLLLGKFVHTKNNECIDTSISVEDLRQALRLSDGQKNYKQIQQAVKDFGENGSVGLWEEVGRNTWDWVWMPYFKKIRLKKQRSGICLE